MIGSPSKCSPPNLIARGSRAPICDVLVNVISVSGRPAGGETGSRSRADHSLQTARLVNMGILPLVLELDGTDISLLLLEIWNKKQERIAVTVLIGPAEDVNV